MSDVPSRDDRRHVRNTSSGKRVDKRSPAERDRDRILYSSAFRRLAEVTQVVSANDAHVFHNRLTHSLQVAQVGRRIAERLIKDQSAIAGEIEELSPDVVEAACLAHDIGHPPFGHTAEETLNKLAGSDISGFEGNAQSFRIVTKLAFRSPDHPGLDLTRATLCALLKYPWLREENAAMPDKWGAYNTEKDDFCFARELIQDILQRTTEAEIMDWADDVTYSVHDIEDFYRAGRIPLHLLASRKDDTARKYFFDDVFRRRQNEGGIWKQVSRKDLEEAFEQIVISFPLDKPYVGSKEQRSGLRKFTAFLIGRFVNGINLRIPTQENKSRVEIVHEFRKEVAMFKELTWTYVITLPAMATHHHGQQHVIKDLFSMLHDAAKDEKKRRILPIYYQELLEDGPSKNETKRMIIDLIAGMTEKQAIAMYQRLKGIALGSGLEEILI